MEADYSVKIVIAGKSGVGKTNLLTRYSNDEYKDSEMPTIGINFMKCQYQHNNQLINLHLWDTAG